MNKVFVDTSGWLAVVSSSDSLHTAAVEIYLNLLASGHDLVTHDGVLLELGNALSGTKSRSLSVKLRENILSSERIELVSLNSTLIDAGWKLYSERPDKSWGIIDCLSFVLMQELDISNALTADRHFEQAGFAKLL